MAIRNYVATLEGLSPLLMHWDNLDWADQTKAARTLIKETRPADFSAGDDRCPPETWRGCVYNDGELVALPSDVIRASFVRGGAQVTQSGKKTYKSMVPAAVLFPDEYCQFFNDGKPLDIKAINAIKGDFPAHTEAVRQLGFALLTKRANVGGSKHVRVRPIFRKWSVVANLMVIDDAMTIRVLEQVVERAGLCAGLGDWRPGSPKSPGSYGRYRATLKAV